MSCSEIYDDNTNYCDKKNDDGSAMTAKDACEQVSKKGSGWLDVAKDVMSLVNPITAATEMIKAFGSNSESGQEIINRLNIDIKLDTITKQSNKCYNSTAQSGTNIIKCEDSEACGEIQKIYAEMGAPVEDVMKLGCNISNVDQSNIATSETICVADTMIEALSNMDASIDNQTLMSVINEAKGLMSGSSSDQFVCNDISTTMSACKYMNVNQCCDNSVIQNQVNALEIVSCGGSANGINQRNNFNAKESCLLSASAKVSDSASADTSNKSVADAENYSEGLTMDFFVVIIMVLLLIFFGVPAFGIGVMKKYVWLLGIVLIIIGALLLSRYSKNAARDEYTGKKSISDCLGSCAVVSEPYDLADNTTDDLMNAVRDSGAQGYEVEGGDVFFIENLNKKKKNCKDKNAVDKLGKCNKTIDESYLKEKKRPLALISGVSCLAIGVILLLVGLVKMAKGGKSSMMNSQVPMMAMNSQVPMMAMNNQVPMMAMNSQVPMMAMNNQVPMMAKNNQVPMVNNTK